MKKVKIQHNRGHEARLSDKYTVPANGSIIIDESEWKEIYGAEGSRILRRAVQDNIFSILAVPEEAPLKAPPRKVRAKDTTPSAE